MARDDWLAAQARDFLGLRGSAVRSWAGVEMALREDVDGRGPQFQDSAVPCLQLTELWMRPDDGAPLCVGTYQDDTVWGLWAVPDAEPGDVGRWTGIFRWRALSELPVGEVEDVETGVEDGVLAEVRLRIAGRPVVLVAGELSETGDGGLDYHRLDESVLVFTDPAAARGVGWPTGSG